MSQSASHLDIARSSSTFAPSESRLVRFADLLLQPLRNGVYKTKEFHGRGVKIVNMGELFGYPRLADIPMKRVELSSSELEKSQLRTGDLLFARRSLVAEGAGRCCLVKDAREPTTFESSIIRARPDEKQVLSEYLFYFFSSPQGRELMRTILRQVAVSGITGSDLAELKIPVPSLRAQRHCVAILGALEDRIELLRQTNVTLEATAQTLFKSWFVDFDPVHAKAEGREPDGMDATTAALFPSSFEDSPLGPIPRGWHAGSLGAISSNPRKQAKPEQIDPATPYFGLEHLPRKSIALGNRGNAQGLASGKFWFERSDILFGKLRPYFHKVGLAPSRGICSTDILVLRPTRAAFHSFLLMHASSDALIDYATRLSNGAKMPRSSWKDVSGYPIAIPQDSLGDAFNRYVEPLLERILTNVETSRSLSELRDTLLPHLISGKLRLPDAQALIEEATP